MASSQPNTSASPYEYPGKYKHDDPTTWPFHLRFYHPRVPMDQRRDKAGLALEDYLAMKSPGFRSNSQWASVLFPVPQEEYQWNEGKNDAPPLDRDTWMALYTELDLFGANFNKAVHHIFEIFGFDRGSAANPIKRTATFKDSEWWYGPGGESANYVLRVLRCLRCFTLEDAPSLHNHIVKTIKATDVSPRGGGEPMGRWREQWERAAGVAAGTKACMIWEASLKTTKGARETDFLVEYYKSGTLRKAATGNASPWNRYRLPAGQNVQG
jgi:hypothetical protein